MSTSFIAGADNTHAVGYMEQAWIDMINRVTSVNTIDRLAVHATQDPIQIDPSK